MDPQKASEVYSTMPLDDRLLPSTSISAWKFGRGETPW